MEAKKNLKKRIGLFLPSLTGGGAEKVMLNLAQGFLTTGQEVDLILVKKEGPYKIPSGVNVVSLHGKHTSLSIVALRRYLRHVRPDVILSAMNYANVVVLWARKLSKMRIPVIIAEHTTFSLAMKNPPNFRTRLILPILMRLIYPTADKIIAVSKGVAEDLAKSIGIPRERIKVIYNPIHLNDILSRMKEVADHPWFRSGEPPVILSVGRLHWTKDYPTLLRAFSFVRTKVRARLIILGDGEERPQLNFLARELDIAEDVDMPGFVKNPYKFMAASKVFVLSSRVEGFPNALLEAIACGCPVVATDCPSGPREILEVTGVGRLVPVGDPESMAKAILEAMEKGEKKEPNLRPFLLENVVKQYMEVCGL